MSRHILLACLATAACLFASWSTADPQAQTRNADRFLIGVLRADGLIVPFAQYRNGRWLTPWPRPESYSEAPNSDEPAFLTELSKPWFDRYVKPSSIWYLTSLKESGEVVRTSRIVKADSHCQKLWGLVSDYPGLTDERGYYEKRGVVLSAKQKLIPMPKRDNTSPDGARVRDFIASNFRRAETVGLSQMAKNGVPIDIPPAEERDGISLAVRKLYSGDLGINGKRIYYFESLKEYRKRESSNDPGCNSISIYSGWIVQDRNDRLSLIASQAYLTDCDEKEGGTKTPLGILFVEGRTFVIVEELGYESESYLIFELNGSGIHRLLETAAGSC